MFIIVYRVRPNRTCLKQFLFKKNNKNLEAYKSHAVGRCDMIMYYSDSKRQDSFCLEALDQSHRLIWTRKHRMYVTHVCYSSVFLYTLCPYIFSSLRRSVITNHGWFGRFLALIWASCFVQLSEQISYGKLNLDAFTPYLYVFPTHNYLAEKRSYLQFSLLLL